MKSWQTKGPIRGAHPAPGDSSIRQRVVSTPDDTGYFLIFRGSKCNESGPGENKVQGRLPTSVNPPSETTTELNSMTNSMKNPMNSDEEPTDA